MTGKLEVTPLEVTPALPKKHKLKIAFTSSGPVRFEVCVIDTCMNIRLSANLPYVQGKQSTHFLPRQ